MRIWLTCFILLFGAAELLQWIKQFSLPLPVFVIGGVFLAVISNYDKLNHLPFHLDYEEPELPQASTPVVESAQSVKAQPVKVVTLPDHTKRSKKPISFEIQKPFKPGD